MQGIEAKPEEGIIEVGFIDWRDSLTDVHVPVKLRQPRAGKL